MPSRFDLTTARLRAGLTQAQLARAAGVGVMTVSEIERGVARRVELDTLDALADVLGVPTASLIVGTPAPPKRKRGRPPKPRSSPPG